MTNSFTNSHALQEFCEKYDVIATFSLGTKDIKNVPKKVAKLTIKAKEKLSSLFSTAKKIEIEKDSYVSEEAALINLSNKIKELTPSELENSYKFGQ